VAHAFILRFFASQAGSFRHLFVDWSLLTEILPKGTRRDGTPENFDDKRVKTLENAVEVKSCGW